MKNMYHLEFDDDDIWLPFIYGINSYSRITRLRYVTRHRPTKRVTLVKPKIVKPRKRCKISVNA